MMERLLTVHEVAERLQVKPSWVYANAESIGGLKVGKYWRFSWNRVMQRLERESESLGSQTNDRSQGVDNERLQNGEEQEGNSFCID